MDKKCVFIDRICSWLNTCEKIPPIYSQQSRTRSYNTSAPLIVLGYQAKGSFGKWNTANKEFELAQNQLMITCCHRGSSSQTPAPNSQYWYAAINMENIAAFDDLWERPIHAMIPVVQKTKLLSAYIKVSQLLALNSKPSQLFLKAAVLELFGTACEEFNQNKIKPLPHAIEKAIYYMSSHYHDSDLCLKDIADKAGLSSHHFGRTFSKTMNISAMHYLREMRIHQSCQLLESTALRISEISDSVGFKDPLHFSRVFKDQTGKSPSKYLEN